MKGTTTVVRVGWIIYKDKYVKVKGLHRKTNSCVAEYISTAIFPWYLYKMVAQYMLRTYEEK